MINRARIEYDLGKNQVEAYSSYWREKNHTPIPTTLFREHPKVWLEVGAGSGTFFCSLAKLYPEALLVAIERSRMRGQRLLRKASRSKLPNFTGFRGNAIPALIHGIPDESVERVYILYPCPWAKTAQRKNRWYLHPIMSHLVRILKPGGLIVWASDQRFYIDEAQFVCGEKFGMETLAHGEIAPNPYNDLDKFPGGRTKFERTFLEQGFPCHEVIVRKR